MLICGWSRVIVSTILIMYNDGWLEIVLLKFSMRKSIWYVNVFEFEKVSTCELRRLDVDLGIFWLISKKRLKLACFDWFWKELKMTCFENGTLWFCMETWFWGILWRDITCTTDLCFLPNLFRNEIGSGMSMPFEGRVKNDLKWESYVRRKIGGWICKFCSF